MESHVTYRSSLNIKHFGALKFLNFDQDKSGEKRKIQMHELEEMRNQAYESSRLYKEKAKKYHDKRIIQRNFRPGQMVLLFISRLRLFSGKLKSKWSGPFMVKDVKPYGAVELEDRNTKACWIVNRQRLKPYFGGEVDRLTSTISLGNL